MRFTKRIVALLAGGSAVGVGAVAGAVNGPDGAPAPDPVSLGSEGTAVDIEGDEIRVAPESSPIDDELDSPNGAAAVDDSPGTNTPGTNTPGTNSPGTASATPNTPDTPDTATPNTPDTPDTADSPDEENSGPSDNSGPGSGGEDDDNSGAGSGEDDNSGSGFGDDSSGSGS